MMFNLRMALLAGSYVAVMAAGWFVHGWYMDSVELAKKNATDAALAAFERKESGVAKKVERQLAELRANERTRVIRVPEIIKQPELVRVCLSEDAINSINAAVGGLRDDRSAESDK